MTRVFWVRHGPTHAKAMVGWSDLPADLTDTARLERLSNYLPQGAILISSDLIRASATADSISGSRFRLPHEAGLREIHFGTWEMQAFDTIPDQERLRAFWDNPGSVRAPEGESWHEVTQRVDRAIARIMMAHPGRDIIAVAHMGVILTQVQQALRVSTHEVFAQMIHNLSVSELQWTGQDWTAGAINHCP